jgi:membrane peptidoglycan carboxypeptidase
MRRHATRTSTLLRFTSILGILFLTGTTLTLVGAWWILKHYREEALTYDLRKLGEYEVTTFFYDRSGREIGRTYVEDRTVVSINDIPETALNAVIAVEDKNFYTHAGLDYRAILRAFLANLKAGARLQGGSTITQQLAKHLIGNFERTFERKLVEAFLARRIEENFSKREILEFYLNRIYFGKGHHGLASAARGYFGKQIQELELGEAALLAGIIKAPSSRSPRNNIEKALIWRNHAIQRMVELNLVDKLEAERALSSEVVLVKERAIDREHGIQSYFMALAAKELDEVLKGKDDEQNITQGLHVHTTLDLALQEQLEKEVSARLETLERDSHALHDDLTEAVRGPLQGAAVLLELKTGAIRALVGGRSFRESPFDRATMARRDHGNLLHPFLYALGFEKLKLNPSSLIQSAHMERIEGASPADLALGDPTRDLDKRFLTVHDALCYANRSCAIRLSAQLGMGEEILRWVGGSGFLSPPRKVYGEFDEGLYRPHLSLAEITSLYQALGNGGVLQKQFSIERIYNTRGEVVHQTQPTGVRVLNETVARQMTLTLQSTVQEGISSPLSKYYSSLHAVAGLAAYSQGNRDAWFAGYTPSLAGGVWVGYDQSIALASKAVAMQSAMPIWARMIEEAAPRLVVGDARKADEMYFPVPANLTKVELNRQTGALRGVGFLSPARGDILVYLTPTQISGLPQDQVRIASRMQSLGENDWLNTMVQARELVPREGASAGGDTYIPPVVTLVIPPLRGKILTTDHRPLAQMIQTHQLVLSWPSPQVASGEDEILAWTRGKFAEASAWLGKPVQVSNETVLAQYRFQRFQPLTVAIDIPRNKVEEFPGSHLARHGFSIQGIPRRIYPLGRSFSHGVGYLLRSRIARTDRELMAGDVIYDDYHGSAGLEQIFDDKLRGMDGELRIMTTSDGFARMANVRKQPVEGLSVRTTLDSRVQTAVEMALDASDVMRAGAMVILDARNGDVLAMASRPNFDPNSFLPALLPAQWERLSTWEKNPLLDRSYRQRNPPGSTFKVVTSLAAMQAGVFDPNRVVHCPGYFQVGNIIFRFPHETQDVSYLDALARSCNTYFMDLGLKTGRNVLVQTARDFGVGEATGFILPGEEPGLMPDNQFVLATHKRWMGPGDVANSSIGQGDILMTPLQAANLMVAIANGGYLYTPRLVTALEDSHGKVLESYPPKLRRVISMPVSMNYLHRALALTVSEGTGTYAKVPGVSIAAKTGTAQVGSKRLPRQIAWMIGYSPAEDPKYAFAVMVEGDLDQNLYGGSTAGPIVAQAFARISAAPAATQIVELDLE